MHLAPMTSTPHCSQHAVHHLLMRPDAVHRVVGVHSTPAVEPLTHTCTCLHTHIYRHACSPSHPHHAHTHRAHPTHMCRHMYYTHTTDTREQQTGKEPQAANAAAKAAGSSCTAMDPCHSTGVDELIPQHTTSDMSVPCTLHPKQAQAPHPTCTPNSVSPLPSTPAKPRPALPKACHRGCACMPSIGNPGRHGQPPTHLMSWNRSSCAM